MTGWNRARWIDYLNPSPPPPPVYVDVPGVPGNAAFARAREASDWRERVRVYGGREQEAAMADGISIGGPDMQAYTRSREVAAATPALPSVRADGWTAEVCDGRCSTAAPSAYLIFVRSPEGRQWVVPVDAEGTWQPALVPQTREQVEAFLARVRAEVGRGPTVRMNAGVEDAHRDIVQAAQAAAERLAPPQPAPAPGQVWAPPPSVGWAGADGTLTLDAILPGEEGGFSRIRWTNGAACAASMVTAPRGGWHCLGIATPHGRVMVGDAFTLDPGGPERTVTRVLNHDQHVALDDGTAHGAAWLLLHGRRTRYAPARPGERYVAGGGYCAEPEVIDAETAGRRFDARGWGRLDPHTTSPHGHQDAPSPLYAFALAQLTARGVTVTDGAPLAVLLAHEPRVEDRGLWMVAPNGERTRAEGAPDKVVWALGPAAEAPFGAGLHADRVTVTLGDREHTVPVRPGESPEGASRRFLAGRLGEGEPDLVNLLHAQFCGAGLGHVDTLVIGDTIRVYLPSADPANPRHERIALSWQRRLPLGVSFAVFPGTKCPGLGNAVGRHLQGPVAGRMVDAALLIEDARLALGQVRADRNGGRVLLTGREGPPPHRYRVSDGDALRDQYVSVEALPTRWPFVVEDGGVSRAAISARLVAQRGSEPAADSGVMPTAFGEGVLRAADVEPVDVLTGDALDKPALGFFGIERREGASSPYRGSTERETDASLRARCLALLGPPVLPHPASRWDAQDAGPPGGLPIPTPADHLDALSRPCPTPEPSAEEAARRFFQGEGERAAPRALTGWAEARHPWQMRGR